MVAYTLANWKIRQTKPHVRLFFACSGVIFVQRDNRCSRNMVKTKCIELLKSGYDLAFYPESTWNFTHAEHVLPFRHGVIKIAAATGAPIVPISLRFLGGRYYVEVGAPLRFNSDNSMDTDAESEDIHSAAVMLRDSLATLKWAAREKYANRTGENGMFRRKDIPAGYFEDAIVRKIVQGHKARGIPNERRGVCGQAGYAKQESGHGEEGIQEVEKMRAGLPLPVRMSSFAAYSQSLPKGDLCAYALSQVKERCAYSAKKYRAMPEYHDRPLRIPSKRPSTDGLFDL